MPTSLTLERSHVSGSGLEFETAGGLTQAIEDGCFLLAIPQDLDVSPGITLCREFYRRASESGDPRDGYRGFREREGIYFDREHFQTEHLLLDGDARRQHFTPELIAMCDRMSELGLVVLRVVLDALKVDQSAWSTATGNAVDGRGTHWFAASHYRVERDQLGCAPHKDTGFTTVLYIDQEGLEAAVDDEWVSIDPVPGYFVINFGGSLELLTRQMREPVRAILHRVRQCRPVPGREDRFSFAAFANPPATGDLYELTLGGELARVQSVEEFLRDFNRHTWSDGYDDFGIVTPGSGEPEDRDVSART